VTSLRARMFLAFLVVSLTGTTLAAILAARALSNAFGLFLVDQTHESLAGWLGEYYQATGDWQGIEARLPGALALRDGMHGSAGMMGGFALVDAQGRVVIPGAGVPPGARLGPAQLRDWTPILAQGRWVGSISVGPSMGDMMGAAGLSFLERVYRGLMLAALGGTGLALVFAIALARSVTRPIQELTEATRQVAQGQLGLQVPVRSRDEVGTLASSFNRMSAELARNRELRRQMAADVAHELRTPLSIIMGHTEALRDGVVQPSLQSLGVVHEEAIRLARLVEDLRVISLAEAGELPLVRRPTEPADLMARAATAHAVLAQQKGIVLPVEAPAGLPQVDVDPDRLAQVLHNLLDNALRHTPQGGRVSLRAEPHAAAVRFHVHDSGSGVAEEDGARLFERFYRADPARARDQGGSGLGLAIAKTIVEAHGGRIWVESPPGGGADFVFEIPTSPPNPSPAGRGE
jgi:signal transduction histidine kinase